MTEKRIPNDTKRLAGIIAGRNTRAAIDDACAEVGLTVKKVAQTILDGMESKAVKIQMDVRGEWQTSDEYIDHGVRLKAVEMAMTLMDLKPAEKHEVDIMSLMSDSDLDNQLKALMGKASQDE